MNAAAQPQILHLTPHPDDETFDGIGVVDGGGATSVLLKDYPEPQRSEILDLLYLPRFGASVSTLLVEIPGDGNATQGSMPSHRHTREDLETHRGYTWWVLREAKRRNPDLSLDAVAWGAPGWLGDGEFWSQDTADYYVSWLTILRDVHGLELDAIGCRNEKGVSLDFAKKLRATLDDNGFDAVRIHGFDNWPADKFDFVAELASDAEAAAAIDIIGAHVLYDRPDDQTPAEVRRWARENGKPIWNTEDHVYRPGFACLIGIVECFNESYLLSGATKTVMWHGIAGVYPLEPYSEEPAAVMAREPWSGHYVVRDALWAYAHYGQFTSVGWRYLDGASAALTLGGSAVSLHSGTGDWTTVVETDAAPATQTVLLRLGPGLSAGPVHVWRSDEASSFQQLSDLEAENGVVRIELEPDSVYTLSTTTGQRKGMTHPPSSAPFPLPYRDDFAESADRRAFGHLPRYTADIAGAFEYTEVDGVSAIRQMVPAPTLSWAPDWKPYTIIGDQDWEDYDVSVRVRLSAGESAGVMARIDHVGTGYGFVPQCYYAEVHADGTFRLVEINGKTDKLELVGDAEQQAIIRASGGDADAGGERVLAAGAVPAAPDVWRDVALRVEGRRVSFWIDGVERAAVEDDRHPRGMAGLIAGIVDEQTLSQPAFTDLRIAPLIPGSDPPRARARAPLYP
ncbi:family 16 glycoside hydrolase [Microbacterium sp. 179-I 1D1 NHS]|uniref:family 16 glycoside hydrolase n=1 Tax=Microbacterium sp. 179-I 1D1 NHS TaxID=3374298 RepID=UPI00387947E5